LANNLFQDENYHILKQIKDIFKVFTIEFW